MCGGRWLLRSLTVILLAGLLASCGAARQGGSAPTGSRRPSPAKAPADTSQPAPNAGEASPDPTSSAPAPAQPAPSTPPAATKNPAPLRPAPGRLPDFTSVDMRTPGGWVPVEAGATLPEQSLTLRFRYETDVTPDDFKGAWNAGQGWNWPQFHFPEPGVAEVFLPVPPRYLLFTVAQKGWVPLYFGNPPRLLSLDPATGKERVIGAVPPNVEAAWLSPDGRWVALAALREPGMVGDLHLASAATGEVRPLPFQTDVGWGDQVAWHNDRLVVTRGSTLQIWDTARNQPTWQASEANLWRTVSPDGRYMLGYHFDYSSGANPRPASLVLLDLGSLTEKVVPGVVGVWVRSCSIMLNVAWEPDGKKLLVEDRVTQDSARLYRLDPATAAISPVPGQTELAQPPGPMSAQGWQLLRTGWGQVKLRSPKGEQLQRGEGFPIGWTPDGALLLIRWENSDYRIPAADEC